MSATVESLSRSRRIVFSAAIVALTLTVTLLADCGAKNTPGCGGQTCAANQTCVNGACQNNSPPACGGQTCTTGQVCVNNTCQTPSTGHCGDGKCQQGETTANCCQDCGCPKGLVCTTGSCVQGAYCGDGICQPTESMDTCCVDCGCPAGSDCDGKQCVDQSTTSTVTFTIGNGCLDDVNFRIFDDSDAFVWPDADSYWTASSGTAPQQTVTCLINDNICYGAETPDGSSVWGVGLNDEYTCADCCVICGQQTSLVANLSCN